MLDQPYITLREAASLICANRVTILDMLRDGRLRGWRIPGGSSRRWRIERPRGGVSFFKRPGRKPNPDAKCDVYLRACLPLNDALI